MEKQPNMPSPEEVAKIEKERTLSDAELIKNGADYKINEKGNKILEVTDEQIEEIKEANEKEDKEKAEQIKTAIEKLGEENVFGPEKIEKTFGVHLKEVPKIPFSVEDMERARELGQILVFRTDKTKDGKPMTLEAMETITTQKFKKEKKGVLLDSSDPSWKRVTGWKFRDEERVPRRGWALVSKDLLPDSTNKDYIAQTEVIIKTLQEKVFKDVEMPEEYVEAIDEFRFKIKKLAKRIDKLNNVVYYDQRSLDNTQVTRELSELQINQLTRPSIQEIIYDLALYYDTHGEQLLADRYAWSNSTSSTGETMVRSGRFFDNDEGVRIEGSFFNSKAGGNTGVLLSRRS